MPAGVSIASIKDAVATLQCGKEWEAKLTLVPAPAALPAAQENLQSEVQAEAAEEAVQLGTEPAGESAGTADAAGPVLMVTGPHLEPSLGAQKRQLQKTTLHSSQAIPLTM